MISALRLNIAAKRFTSLISSLKHARPSGNSSVVFAPLIAPAGDPVLAGLLVTGTRSAGCRHHHFASNPSAIDVQSGAALRYIAMNSSGYKRNLERYAPDLDINC